MTEMMNSLNMEKPSVQVLLQTLPDEAARDYTKGCAKAFALPPIPAFFARKEYFEQASMMFERGIVSWFEVAASQVVPKSDPDWWKKQSDWINLVMEVTKQALERVEVEPEGKKKLIIVSGGFKQ